MGAMSLFHPARKSALLDFSGRDGVVEFRNRKDIQDWLMDKPREVSVAIAARAALRVLPLMNGARREENFESAILLPVFHGAAIPAFAGTWPKAGMDAARAARAAAGAGAAGAAYTAYAVGAAYAAYAAHAAAGAAYAAADAVDDAAYAVGAVNAAYAAVSKDAAFLARFSDGDLEQGLLELARTPLWPDHGLSLPEETSKNWHALKTHLLSREVENWQVWTDWYEDRLNGFANRDPNMELEKARIERLTKAAWNHPDNPAHVNGILAGIEEEFRASKISPEQIVSLHQDETVATAVIQNQNINLVPPAKQADFEAATSPIVSQLHQASRRQLHEMMNDVYELANRPDMRGIGGTYDRLTGALGDTPQQFAENIASYWAELCELGSYLEADDDKKFVPPIDLSVRRRLDAFLKTSAPLVRNLPTGLELDEAVKAYKTPAERFGAAAGLVELSSATSLLTEHDVEMLREFIAAANRGDFQGLKLKNYSTRIMRNVAMAMISGVAGLYLGAASSVMATDSVVANKIAETLLEGEGYVLELFADHPFEIRKATKELIDDLRNNKRDHGSYYPEYRIYRRPEDES